MISGDFVLFGAKATHLMSKLSTITREFNDEAENSAL